MSVNYIDAALLKKMFLAGARSLESKKEWINELNVFPVPDGDTGTNMTLTIMSAAKEVEAIADPDMASIAKAMSSGSLRGARGNSGVILSQLFRGFTKEIKTVQAINADVIAKAFQRAVETAYKAVMKPKEGTILTVAKGMADKAAELTAEGTPEDLEAFMTAIIEHGDLVLSQTPDMLPVLKQAGVVDSGGQGLMEVVRGALDGYLGKDIVSDAGENTEEAPEAVEEEIVYGYCTEFAITLQNALSDEAVSEFKGYLESVGESVFLSADNETVKVHLHTTEPGNAITKALTYGSLSRVKIDNMREEHEETLLKEIEKELAEKAEAEKHKEPRKEVGFIAVSVGAGMNEIIRGLNVDYIIEGGQTMNPSTEDMLNAIDQVNADTIYIFPNNKNIILAAEQAVSLTEDKQIIVVPSKTVPQGITAVINYIPGVSAEENKETMIEEMSRVKTGEVTYAVRDTSLDGFEIKQGDIMGIGDSGIMAVGKQITDTAVDLIAKMVDDESELISIYYGQDVTEEDANAFLEKVQEQFPDVDIELHNGGQPVYYYVMSVE